MVSARFASAILYDDLHISYRFDCENMLVDIIYSIIYRQYALAWLKPRVGCRDRQAKMYKRFLPFPYSRAEHRMFSMF